MNGQEDCICVCFLQGDRSIPVEDVDGGCRHVRVRQESRGRNVVVMPSSFDLNEKVLRGQQ